ncbi:hypothetical protein [Brenneria rubrifaciens]|uniref:Integrase n=1 Tax=Brenneria rubrifaciens TaxID=55213 RepID=A0A4P8QMG1_9GAMM|nr:hypothetical protein [Brenneria rubrifaciens]QCR07476.1 hypothetical protein EH207_02255 [Brenneria rubrifaciens]
MAISKQPSGKWLLQCFPNDRDGKRIREQFTTKGEALAYERYIKDESENKPWLGENKIKEPRPIWLISNFVRMALLSKWGNPKKCHDLRLKKWENY